MPNGNIFNRQGILLRRSSWGRLLVAKGVGPHADDKIYARDAIEMAGRELVQIAETIGPLGKATQVLNVARRWREIRGRAMVAI